MPEYVYALHDFEPEHEDEISFHAGERIELVEKDDEFGDGWWQGRNSAGKFGLFPATYTTPVPPSTETAEAPTSTPNDADQSHSSSPQQALGTLAEESETDSVTSPTQNGHANGVNGRPHVPLSAVMGNGTGSAESGVMDATMTDVQEAIEQLGRRRQAGEDGDGERSFSFASTGDGDDRSYRYDGETDETDGEEGEGWHKDARQKLAEKARRAVEEAEKLDAIMNSGGSIGKGKGRLIAPPIDVEMSDESEDEGDHTMHSYIRNHPIPEESEEEDGITDEFGRRLGRGSIKSDGGTQSSTLGETGTLLSTSTMTVPTAKASDSNSLEIPPKEEDELPTVTQSTFERPPPITLQEPSQSQSQDGPEANQPSDQPNAVTSNAAATLSLPSPISPAFQIARSHSTPPPRAISPQLQPPPQSIPVSHSEASSPVTMGVNNVTSIMAERRQSSPGITYRESLIALPSPSPSSLGGFAGLGHSKHSSIASSAPGNFSPVVLALGGPTNGITEVKERTPEKRHPSDWSVEEVVDWLKSKGFDQDVCDKFTEQEITGDVLLELDVNLLKTEIGIMAFGKRMRIANAVTDLRRPPSIVYSDHQSSVHQNSLPASPMHPNHPASPHSPPMHSPLSMQNLNQAHQSYTPSYGAPQSAPGSQYVHSRTVSQSHSFGGYTHNSSAHQSLNSPITYGSVINGVPPPVNEVLDPALTSDEGRNSTTSRPTEESRSTNGAPVGLGIVEADVGTAGKKSRPAQLNLSPSESTLNDLNKAHEDPPPADDDERALSESEAGPASSVRRRFFGGSRNSSSSMKEVKPDRTSKDSTTSPRMISASASTSPTLKDNASDKEKETATVGTRHKKSKGSLDSKPVERLSIFGGSFAGSLGKGRKPPPRYSGTQEEPIEKTSSHLSFSRLYGGSKRPSTSHGTGTSPKTSPRPYDSVSSKEHKEKDNIIHPSLLRKRTTSASSPKADTPTTAVPTGRNGATLKQGQSILEQIGEPDHNGWMRKKSDGYSSWKTRYFVLKGPHLYCLRSNSRAETKIKGYIHITGYRVTVDENVDPGRYGFRIDHENDKTHYFSSEEKSVIREWMKAIMKATIGRDYTKPVVSSCNIPTIPLTVAQAMNPAPRPPSPTARDATQKALRREDPNKLSGRDALVLGLPPNGDTKDERTKLESFFSDRDSVNGSILDTPRQPKSPAPPRPSREGRRMSTQTSQTSTVQAVDDKLIDWANGHLPSSLQITDPNGSLCSGLALLRLAESIKGSPSSPPVPDSAFPRDEHDDKLDGLFKLFDFLLDNDVKIGSVSINDIRQGKREKIIQLLRALKSWEDKRIAIAQSIGKSSVQAGGFMAPVGMPWTGM